VEFLVCRISFNAKRIVMSDKFKIGDRVRHERFVNRNSRTVINSYGVVVGFPSSSLPEVSEQAKKIVYVEFVTNSYKLKIKAVNINQLYWD